MIAKIWKHPKCPSVDEWIKKLWYIYTREHYMAAKKKELFQIDRFKFPFLGEVETVIVRY